MFTSRMFAMPTRIKMSTFLKMPLKPTAEDSRLSTMAHMMPVMYL